jgi:hypothetical protein
MKDHETFLRAAGRVALGHRAIERVLAEFALQKMVSAYEDIYEEFSGKRIAQVSETAPPMMAV